MKIVYISPHLSTGGCPQFLLKKVQLLNKEHEVYCIEYADMGAFTVQKNQIKQLLGDRFFSVNYNKPELIDIIERIQPEVVHLEEMPEYFMDHKIANILYRPDRKYKLVETSHDSSFDPRNKLFFPDRFTFVSRYQQQAQSILYIPSDVIEYPISIVPRKSREEALKVLNLDPNKKHVINVGLFTPRKNQAEIIEYAKKLSEYPIQFHFIGNQADNFKWYWEPLMADFPKNCTWWNERKDVENFYQAADLFLFTSRGTVTDKETSPLVIREAISYNLPSLIYNLPVYMGMYDKYQNIKYLDFESMENNIEKILTMTDIKRIDGSPLTPQIRSKTETHNYPFSARWNADEQKMYYSCAQEINFPIIVSLREYKSNAVMWSAEYQSFPANCEFWMIPVNKSVVDYEKLEYYSGIKICIYKKHSQEQIYEKPFFSKFVNMPTISLSNRVPYFVNFTEYFMQKKYSKWFSGKKYFPVVVDAGANIGVFTEFIIQNKFSRNVVAIDCDPLALDDLKRTYEFSSYVKVVEKALNDTNDPITFYHCPENPVVSSTLDPNKLAHHKAGIPGSNERTVETITLQELVAQLKHIDLLKLDIEGAEYKIIESMDKSLSDHIDNMFIECHFFEKESKERYNGILKKLNSMGYLVDEGMDWSKDDYIGGSECIFVYKK